MKPRSANALSLPEGQGVQKQLGPLEIDLSDQRVLDGGLGRFNTAAFLGRINQSFDGGL